MLHYKVNVSCCDSYRRLGNIRGNIQRRGQQHQRREQWTNGIVIIPTLSPGAMQTLSLSVLSSFFISFISFEMSAVLLCTRKVIPLIIKQIIFIISFLLLYTGAQSAYFVPFSLGPLPPLPPSSLSRFPHPESGDVPLDLLPDERHAAVGHGRHMQGGHGRGQPAGALLVALPQVAQVGGTLREEGALAAAGRQAEVGNSAPTAAGRVVPSAG